MQDNPVLWLASGSADTLKPDIIEYRASFCSDRQTVHQMHTFTAMKYSISLAKVQTKRNIPLLGSF
jgi:hypothetical protein